MKNSNFLQSLIDEANAAWEAKKASVLNQTFEKKDFVTGKPYLIKVLSVCEKGFCLCAEVGKDEAKTIRVSINWVLKGKKI